MRRMLSMFLIPVAAACNSKSDSDDTATSVLGKITSTENNAVNALAVAYPGTLQLSVFPSATASSLTLDDGSASAETDDTGASRPPKEKKMEADKRLRGEAECFDPKQMRDRMEQIESCYEFDSDMNPQSRLNGSSVGTADGLDFRKKQACMASFASKEVNSVIQIVDRSLAQVQGLFCVEKKTAAAENREVRTPEVDGAAIDFTGLLTAKTPLGAPKFIKAEVQASADAETGIVSYTTTIVIRKPDSTDTDTMILRHSPAQEGQLEVETGVLTHVRSAMAGEAKKAVLSLKYQKSTADGQEKMRAELVRANISTNYEPLNEEGFVNYAALPADADNSMVSGSRLVAFDVVPSTGAGNISYWNSPGGKLDESARGFVFNITANDAGLLSGCGISGATNQVSIRKAAIDETGETKLVPVRFWHPFQQANTAPNQNPKYSGLAEGAKVTRQCVTQTAEGLYVIDASKTDDKLSGYDVIEGSQTGITPPAKAPKPRLPPPPKPLAI